MNPISPGPHGDDASLCMDSRDLEQLARMISNRIQVQCPSCKNWQKLTIRARSLRMGSSPDLAVIDPNQQGRPRLVFVCTLCQKRIGFIQADEWAGAAETGDEPTRWEHLELDEASGR